MYFLLALAYYACMHARMIVCYVASLGHCIDVDVMLLCLYARVHLIPGLRVEHQPEQDVLSCSVIVASL